MRGVPVRAPQALYDGICEASKIAGLPGAKMFAAPVTNAAVTSVGLSEGIFSQSNLIVDGADHRSFLSKTLRSARERVLIHSTFLNGHAVNFLPDFLQAAANGAAVDIFWGQDEDRKTQATSRAEAEKLRLLISEKGRSDAIKVHRFTTGSHSKLVISDDGRGNWFVALGSCNWLGSPFDSFEVSVKIRDPAFCGRLVRYLATMSMGRDAVWNQLASDITVLGRKIESARRPNERTVPMRILLAPDHADLALEGSIKAERRLFVTSHRIGVAGRPMVILPALAAAKKNGTVASLYFGKGTDTFSGIAAGQMTMELASSGVTIQPVFVPRLHAKLLGWDDNALAITSQNWLSADPSDNSPLREIGIFINAPNIADQVIRMFEMQMGG